MPESEPDPIPAIRMPWGSLVPAAGTGPPPGEARPVAVPDHTLIRPIGRGAYGEVWLARNALGVHRAVKILHRSAFSDDRPFEREFSGIQRFEPVSRSHESQLNILHVGRGADHFYYVMELADDQTRGTSVDEATYAPRTLRSELCVRGRLPVEECLRLGMALTTALEHLHRHGLVHRDIKPSNIVFVNGIPKLADIGLVALAERTMSFVGTEGYLPPEGPGTAQADLFSLGRVLYEIGTGRDRQQFPELPTEVGELPDLDALSEFNEVLVRACAPDPRQRYRTAAEMHADLALLQSGGSVARQRRMAGQLRWVQRAGMVTTVLAAMVASGWAWQARQTERVRRLAAENAALAAENRDRIARLNVANGVRQLDAGDPGGALLWMVDALSLVTNRPDLESVHRVRIEQTIRLLPRLHAVLTHDGAASVVRFSPDARFVAAGTPSGRLYVWEAASGRVVAPPLESGWTAIRQLRFLGDGDRIFASSLPESGEAVPASSGMGAVVMDLRTRRPVVEVRAGDVARVALSRDERWLVTADASGALCWRDARTGREGGRVAGFTTRPLQLEVSADGRRVAASAEAFPARFQTVGVWRMEGGAPLGEPIRCGRGPMALSPDGRFLAVAAPAADGGDGTLLQVWDLDAGWGAPMTSRHPGTPTALRFPPSGAGALVLLTRQKCVALDPVSGREVGRSFVPPQETTAVATSADGRTIAFGGHTGFAGSWSLDTGWPELSPLPQEVSIEAMDFSPDGRQVAVAGAHGVILVLGAQRLREDGMLRFDAPLGTGTRDEGDPRLLAPDGRRMLVILDDGSVREVDLDRLEERTLPSGPGERKRASEAVYDPTGRFLAIGYGRSARVWGRDGGRVSPVDVVCPEGMIETLGFSADGRHLVAACGDGQVRWWDAVDGRLRHAIPTGRGARVFLAAEVGAVLWESPGEGRFHAIDGPEGRVRVWPGLPSGPGRIVFSPQGDRFATVGPGNTCRVWARDGSSAEGTALDHGLEVTIARWSPDGRWLVTAGSSAEVRVWDAATGALRYAPLSPGAGPVTGVAWSADGRFIAAAAAEGVARVWDASTGDAVTPRLHHGKSVHTLRFAADGRWLTLSPDERLRMWTLHPSRVPADDLAALARLYAGRRLTGAGTQQKLAPSELSSLFDRLRTRQPDRFSTPRSEILEWHRRAVGITLDLTELEAALFHLDRMRELAPDDPDVRRLRSRYQDRRVPPRSPETPAHLLDLSGCYNDSLDTTMYREFEALPRGVHRLAGTWWDLRGGIGVGPGQAVKDIPVRRRCRALHLLHCVGGFRVRDGDEVAHWVIRYEDGSVVEWPVIYGEHLRDWWWNYGHPREARQAEIAWEAQPDILAHGVRLFKATWTNPRPEVPIASMDLVGGDVEVGILVVAITAE